MRIRSISLNNVRRFTSPVRLEGLSNGLNVLCKPNEFGKSTLFDALQAVFFKAHSSSDKDIKALRPHAGGAPEVTVEIETDDGRFTIAKRWMSKPSATIEKDGRLIAQADEAESWISQLLGGGDGGPSGLLWVRQGLTALTEGSKKEQKAALEARRDLLSSVTGEVEAMTGGRRMDMALARCREELLNFATPKGRPKAGGPWKAAEELVEALLAEHKNLATTATNLRHDLKERKRKRRELTELEDPEAAASRKERLKDATAELQAAERHAEAVESESRKVDAARLIVTNLKTRLTTLRDSTKERTDAEEAVANASKEATAASLNLESAEATRAKAQLQLKESQIAYKNALDALRASQRRQAALDGAERRKELIERIKNAQTARNNMESAAAEAKRGPDSKSLRQLEDLASDLTTARAIRDGEAAQLIMAYDEGSEGKIKRNGEELPGDRPLAIPNGADLAIEGIGVLTVSAGTGGQDDGSVDKAEKALFAALERHGCTTIEEARNAAEARDAAEHRRMEAKASLDSLAPDGIEDLRAKLAAIPELKEVEEDVPPLADAEQLLAQADDTRLKAETSRTAATDHLSDARSTSSRIDAELKAAQERLSRATASLGRLGDTDETALNDELRRATTALEAAEALHSEKVRSSPDLAAAEAKLKRAQSVEETARAEIVRLKPELATLDERIARSAGDAVEERLAETDQKLEVAQATLARIEQEVAVLLRLETVLEEARSDARERYFEPVAIELKPLLQLLWPDAELSWGDKTLLPTALIRNGQEEPIEILSGGTKEQVALLVRLAFARMLAKHGHNAPVILDDALVFTDDDRIELMFDALHRQADDLQILVLSCRQRAFRNLGGNSVRVTTRSLSSNTA
ncbi:AAA family ATPase [Hyphococcus luteus]|uniref:Chromosome segregation protein SMC n=1 Tax=Hyphococcus luteus TaxID=2058213 RepID=A0A2S7K090_9PROT|nr:AAA family ATPase [Marinicaulis flavus]PQA85881.1 chromosome segregation protein SMC [Marinicaulis flavus]